MRPLEWSRGESCLNARRELAAVDELLELGGAVLVEGGTCIGKTALLETACPRAARLGREVLRGRGSELEAGFAFGLVSQLFERRLAGAGVDEREALLAGSPGVVRPLLLGEAVETSALESGHAGPRDRRRSRVDGSR